MPPILPYVVLDIETGHAPEPIIARAVAQLKAPSNYKDPGKIAEYLADQAEKVREKSALLDGAPVTAVSVVCGASRHVFTAGSVGGTGESAVLVELRKHLDAVTGPETVLVGHNLCGFDLPNLRAAYIRARLALPMCLRLHEDDDAGKPPVFDTMRRFRFFTSERHDERFVSLADVIDAFGLPRIKEGYSGKDMPALAADGKWDIIREYCLLDTVATEAVYLLMTSSHRDMK